LLLPSPKEDALHFYLQECPSRKTGRLSLNPDWTTGGPWFSFPPLNMVLPYLCETPFFLLSTRARDLPIGFSYKVFPLPHQSCQQWDESVGSLPLSETAAAMCRSVGIGIPPFSYFSSFARRFRTFIPQGDPAEVPPSFPSTGHPLFTTVRGSGDKRESVYLPPLPL